MEFIFLSIKKSSTARDGTQELIIDQNVYCVGIKKKETKKTENENCDLYFSNIFILLEK